MLRKNQPNYAFFTLRIIKDPLLVFFHSLPKQKQTLPTDSNLSTGSRIAVKTLVFGTIMCYNNKYCILTTSDKRNGTLYGRY